MPILGKNVLGRGNSRGAAAGRQMGTEASHQALAHMPALPFHPALSAEVSIHAGGLVLRGPPEGGLSSPLLCSALDAHLRLPFISPQKAEGKAALLAKTELAPREDPMGSLCRGAGGRGSPKQAGSLQPAVPVSWDTPFLPTFFRSSFSPNP